MYRYFLYIKFNGKDYHGWQVQPNAITVQEEIEEALSKIVRKKMSVVGAGRTDTEVHSSCMIAHFDIDEKIVIDEFKFQLNSVLSPFISIFNLREVSADFHARFNAVSRTYNYQICKNKEPFLHDFAYRLHRELDLDKMNKAADLLLGTKDFSCFSKSNTQTFTNDCTLLKAEWKETEWGYLFVVQADRFLRNMVRAIVGTLIEVGEGKRTVDSIHNLIASKDRSYAGTSVPAKGLFLVDVEYPEEGFI